MKIIVRYFASLREAVGAASEEIDFAGRTVADLQQFLVSRGPLWQDAFAPEKRISAAVNFKTAKRSTMLTEGCEVAFFPPVTGG